MTKRITDNILYFYYEMMHKWKGSIWEATHHSKVDVSSSTGVPSGIEMKIVKHCANELGMEVEELVDGAFEIKSGNVTKRFRNLASPENSFTNWLCGNKYATFEILKKYGFQHIPYYQRYSLATIEEARQDFRMRSKAVVIKPSAGTHGGDGVTVNIQNIKDLNRAIFNSLRFASNYLIEDYIEGDNFRILFFKDKMLNAALRLPANVNGDGINSIDHLIKMENERRAKDHSLFHLNPILIDNDVKQTLLNKKISLNYVPTKDETVYVRTLCNYHAGGEVRDVTSIVHPDTIRECQSIMKIMNITWGGIDVITKDIKKPLAEKGGAINEVNTGPGLEIYKEAVPMKLLELTFEGI